MASPRGTKRRADDPSSPYTGLSRPLSIENSAVEYEQLKERIRLRNRSLNASRLLDPLSPPRYLSRSDVERPMASGPHVARPELDYGDRDGNHGSYSGRVDDGAAQRRESLEEGEIRREGEDRMNSPFPHTFSPDRPTTATAMGSPPPQRNPIQPRDYEPQMRPPGSRPAHPGWPTIAQDQYEDRTAPSVPHPSHQLRPTLKTKFVNGATVPITCRWWKFGGATGCHNTAETCPYAHFDTGVYAELGPRSVVAGSRKRWKKKKRLVQNAADPGKCR
ncbi:hypothetical protein BU16DRAFT_315254 [Lophium mytilinum]|uniref:C3H1-type domain-containing protein n=1 Tax=Lophium mytilinum TaxID=390894 RepID=A0A6A6QZ09_9PEZI|nr:hypothetical protein BU16DRAFT_315254 [Lophium mytilinum]